MIQEEEGYEGVSDESFYVAGDSLHFIAGHGLQRYGKRRGNRSAVGNNEKAANDNGTAKKTVDEQVNEGKPVTLQVFQSSAGITDSEFEELFAKPVKSKYPNVTLELIRESKASINQLMTAGEFPDIIFTPTLNLIKFYRRAVGNPDIVAIDPNSMRLTAQNLLVPFVDPKTEKADLTSEKWKYVFDLYRSIQDIPDNKAGKRGVAGFEKDQTVAMYTSSGGRLEEIEELMKQGVKLDWDMVSYPVPKNAPSKNIVTMAHVLAVSSTAKNKDDAFKIVSYLSTSREVQNKLAKGGFISALKDDI
ncbi:extracellular solute-binding protein [Paenibacillus allorhizosphaerae]|uniref:Extracellular solute-binding protein n=1 Tax=Paenibacillus allorhizosphaerae TaxID=2849866 RepID=A0ABN7TIQ5_9BACL|nr:extracellular solute-binding protein [Paenibacillus allorhizosphaerae]CAG7633456.1 hypothetical protein PAECIP111802_01949 [Paenibacillus allorhizosphaerae]